MYAKPSFISGINRASPLATGLVAAWPFYEGSGGIAHDVGGRDLHGTLTGMIPDTDWVGSERGWVPKFDGVDDVVLAGNAGVITNRISVMTWAKPDVLTRGDLVTQWVDGSANSQFNLLYGVTSGKPAFYISAGAGAVGGAVGSDAMEVGKWHHVCGVYDGANIKIYLDGIFQAETASTITMQTTGVVRIGANGVGNFADCALDDIRIYDRALSADEISLAAAGLDGLYEFDSYLWLPSGAVSPPVADFSADVVSGESPLTVQFTDASTNTPTSWEWDFGDGSAVGTTQNPQHVYAAPGTYTVTLTATNVGGSDAEIKVDYITVSAAPVPVHRWKFDEGV